MYSSKKNFSVARDFHLWPISPAFLFKIYSFTACKLRHFEQKSERPGLKAENPTKQHPFVLELREGAARSDCVLGVTKSGFTLFELLVALLIISIVVMVTVLAVGTFGRTRRNQIQIQQFVNILRLAEQRAVLQPAILGLRLTPEGYRFLRFVTGKGGSKGRWLPIQNDELSAPEAFQDGLSWQFLAIDGRTNVTQAPSGRPSIVFFPDGLVTSFVLQLKGPQSQAIVRMAGNGVVTTSG